MVLFKPIFVLAALLLSVGTAGGSTTSSATAASAVNEWVRPDATTTALVWGRREGIVFGIPSSGGMRGPRGLIRVGVMGSTGSPELINFIAIEPATKSAGPRRIALSELEHSDLDNRQGKRLWTTQSEGELTSRTTTTGTVERLSVRIEVEPFTANGAHVYVIASVSSDRPEELELAVYHHEGSAPVKELTLSATMGNKERLRYLWLNDRVVDSRDIYGDYAGNDFVEKDPYPLENMVIVDGDAMAVASTNEADPASLFVRENPSWTYRSKKLTQYWRVPEAHIQPDLRVRVNGRRVYWLSEVEIPGGVSFENFEVRQAYVPGQVFTFGLTPKEPEQLAPALVDVKIGE